jgi:ABC-type phosphate/phosphonate transport system substrate-binding protein
MQARRLHHKEQFNLMVTKMLRHAICFLVAAYGWIAPVFAADAPPLTVAVMDPLALPLSCPCVKGHAQRRYEKLGAFLESRLDRPVKVLFSDDLSKIIRSETGRNFEVVIGKRSVVEFDARINHLPVRPAMMLTGKDGQTTLSGLIVVSKADRARKLEDLRGYTILFGPPECDEKFAAAAEAIQKAGVDLPGKLETRPGCSDSVIEMLENSQKPTAAVISSYAAALLEGCGTIEKGAIRIIGQTRPVPFVTVFFTPAVDESLAARIQKALSAVRENPELLTALETQSGFVPLPNSAAGPAGEPAAVKKK